LAEHPVQIVYAVGDQLYQQTIPVAIEATVSEDADPLEILPADQACMERHDLEDLSPSERRTRRACWQLVVVPITVVYSREAGGRPPNAVWGRLEL